MTPSIQQERAALRHPDITRWSDAHQRMCVYRWSVMVGDYHFHAFAAKGIDA